MQQDTQKILRAGQITKQVREWIKPQIKKDVLLIEIAKKIESKIFELGGKPAFPVNLSIDNIAAHYTPSYNDKTTAKGLLKVDFGVHIDGWIADNAFSIDLENNEENKKLIKASEDALNNSIKLIKSQLSKSLSNNVETVNRKTDDKYIKLNEIGGMIEKTIESYGFSPIINLSGHSIDQYKLHSGISIPNIDNKKYLILKSGLYAIEPFATIGSGKVHDGAPSGIYELIQERNVRSPIAEKVLEFIKTGYSTLPFCSRWIVEKFGTSALFGLRELENREILHHFPQLVETKESKVSQTEHTILIDEKGKIIVTTD